MLAVHVRIHKGLLGCLQDWLQEFAWTEKDVPRKRQERASSLPPGSYEHFCMDCEPMFCFEVGARQAALHPPNTTIWSP